MSVKRDEVHHFMKGVQERLTEDEVHIDHMNKSFDNVDIPPIHPIENIEENSIISGDLTEEKWQLIDSEWAKCEEDKHLLHTLTNEIENIEKSVMLKCCLIATKKYQSLLDLEVTFDKKIDNNLYSISVVFNKQTSKKIFFIIDKRQNKCLDFDASCVIPMKDSQELKCQAMRPEGGLDCKVLLKTLHPLCTRKKL